MSDVWKPVVVILFIAHIISGTFAAFVMYANNILSARCARQNAVLIKTQDDQGEFGREARYCIRKDVLFEIPKE